MSETDLFTKLDRDGKQKQERAVGDLSSKSTPAIEVDQIHKDKRKAHRMRPLVASPLFQECRRGDAVHEWTC